MMAGRQDLQIGYCTNVHAGSSLKEVLDNIETYSLPVKKLVSPDDPLGIGLWFSSTAAEELVHSHGTLRLRDYLAENALVPFTFNGFPYGDFHQPVVKQKVYLPTWANESRLNYTIQLAQIQDELLPPGMDGSISTLPLGWPTDGFSRLWQEVDEQIVKQCANNLRSCANFLHRQFETTGRRIRLAIEPEPGCLIDNCSGVELFFRDYLLTGDSAIDQLIQEYIGICHDVCHSAVMFESQQEAISTYTDCGIRVVKVQVSSAIEICFDALNMEEKTHALTELGQFAEKRYLHQTCVQTEKEVSFFQDLPQVIEEFGDNPAGTWRVHFHVPVFSQKFDVIGTTQPAINACWDAIRTLQPETTHFEIETYAWDVLPERHKSESLQSSIAREINWFRELVIGDA